MIVQSIAVGGLIWPEAFPWGAWWFDLWAIVVETLVWLTLITTVGSGVTYVLKTRAILAEVDGVSSQKALLAAVRGPRDVVPFAGATFFGLGLAPVAPGTFGTEAEGSRSPGRCAERRTSFSGSCSPPSPSTCWAASSPPGPSGPPARTPAPTSSTRSSATS